MRRKRRRKARKRSKPKTRLMDKPLLIHTIFGVSLVQPDSRVLVRLGDEYIRKPAKNLIAGEEVLFAKEGMAGITIEQVDTALAKSRRYTATQPVLFRQLPDDTFTTAFCHALLDGMRTNQNAWPYDMEARFGPGGYEISQEALAEAAKHIRDTLENACVPAVGEKHIMYGWLAGKVIAPRNRMLVFPALLPLSDGIRELMTEKFDSSYKLYVRIRQTIMNYISLMLKGRASTGKEEIRDKEDDNGESICVGPEISLVVEHFASDISQSHAAARVLRIQEVKGEEAEGHGNGHLFKGVVSGGSDIPDIRLKSFGSLMKEATAITVITQRLYFEIQMRLSRGTLTDVPGEFQAVYERHERATNEIINLALRDGLRTYFGYESARLRTVAEMNRRLRRAGIREVGGTSEDVILRDEFFKKGYDSFRGFIFSGVVSGRLDRMFGLERGTLYDFYEYVCKLTSCVPFEFSYYSHLQSIIEHKKEYGKRIGPERKERRRVFDALRRMGYRTREEQGLTAIAACFHASINSVTPPMMLIYAGKLTPREYLVYTVSMLEILPDEHDLRILEGLGFGAITKLYPRADQRIQGFGSLQSSRSPS